jgi:hypothetical protein
MKISETTSYPHPVLAPWSEDIAGATIDTEITFREKGERNQVSIYFSAKLEQSDIVKLIQDGAATFGCLVKCQETGLRRLQRLGFPTGLYHFAPGALLGRVQLRPMVWAVNRIDSYNPEGAHAEFGNGCDIERGQILALDDEQIIDVTRPPLASIESIFEIIASDQVPDGRFDVDTESDRLTVRMSERTYQLVQSLREENEITRNVIMNCLYIPVVMQVLDQLTDGYEQFEQYRWLHPFRGRCELEGIDVEKPDLLNHAQRLLAMPFSALEQLIEPKEDAL